MISADGRTVFAIVRRADGLFGYYEDQLLYDESNDVDYWSIVIDDPKSIFASIDEAERDVRSRHSLNFESAPHP